MRNAGHVVTRTMLLEHVWDYHFDPQTNVIDVHVSRLRQKIDKSFDQPLLHTVRGAGYCLRGPGAARRADPDGRRKARRCAARAWTAPAIFGADAAGAHACVSTGRALLPRLRGLGAGRPAVRLLDQRELYRAPDGGDPRRRNHRAGRAICAERPERPHPDRCGAQSPAIAATR